MLKKSSFTIIFAELDDCEKGCGMEEVETYLSVDKLNNQKNIN